MSNVIGGSYVKEGQASLEITANDLFDKIINLKFTRKSGRSFTIRSDYEPVHHKDGTTSFKRCTQKPDIKVEYKQVSESVNIEVNIRITNLFIGDGDKESTESMNTVLGDPVQFCTIQMGYRAQFPDWTSPRYKNKVTEFYDLALESEIQRANQVEAQILTGYSESYPPDKVTYFKGIIGSMETGLRWDHERNHIEADLVKGYGDPQFPRGLSEIGEALFHFITQRFVRSGIPHISTTGRNFTNLEAIEDTGRGEFEQGIKIFINNEWVNLQLTEDGIMSVEDAKKYGVQCYISRTLQNLRANALYGYGYTPEEIDVVDTVPAVPFNEMHNTVGAQLTAFRQHYPFLRWYTLMDGSYFFYHVRDTDKDLWSDPFVKEMQKENTVFLPAIYDMTPSGTRNIRCPFISFLNPMATVLFQSRYTIGTLVSYFYPPQTNAFLVIISDVKFATVQEENIMDLMCVDLPPKEVVFNSETNEINVRDDNPSEIIIPETAQTTELSNMQWTEKVLKVVQNRRQIRSIYDTEGKWGAIVRNEVLANIRPERWPAGAVITEKMALEALKAWNPEYFDPDGPYMARNNSEHGISDENSETEIGGRTGIEVPWLAAEDRVTVRHPFQREYNPDDRVRMLA